MQDTVQFVINTSTRLNECLQECIFHASVHSFFTARTKLDTWHNRIYDVFEREGSCYVLTKTDYVCYFDR